MGLGLSLLDGGTSQTALMDLALDAVLGANPSNEAVVTLLFTNVAGSGPSAADLNLYTSMLAGELTQGATGHGGCDASSERYQYQSGGVGFGWCGVFVK